MAAILPVTEKNPETITIHVPLFVHFWDKLCGYISLTQASLYVISLFFSLGCLIVFLFTLHGCYAFLEILLIFFIVNEGFCCTMFLDLEDYVYIYERKLYCLYLSSPIYLVAFNALKLLSCFSIPFYWPFIGFIYFIPFFIDLLRHTVCLCIVAISPTIRFWMSETVGYHKKYPAEYYWKNV